jgi:hypothetical protein
LEDVMTDRWTCYHQPRCATLATHREKATPMPGAERLICDLVNAGNAYGFTSDQFLSIYKRCRLFLRESALKTSEVEGAATDAGSIAPVDSAGATLGGGASDARHSSSPSSSAAPGDPQGFVDELTAAIFGVKAEHAERFSVSDALREVERLHAFKREHRRRMSEAGNPTEDDRRFAKMLVDIYDGGDADERIAAYTGEVMNLRMRVVESVAAMIERGDAWEGHQAEGNAATFDSAPLFALKSAIVERVRDMASPFTREAKEKP